MFFCEISHSLIRTDILVIMVKPGNISREHSTSSKVTISFHLRTLPMKFLGYIFDTITLAL